MCVGWWFNAHRYTNPDGSSTLINQSPAWDALICEYSLHALCVLHGQQ